MIYITGDVHGDLKDLEKRDIGKIKKGDVLIITGDFGFLWDNSKSEIKNLNKLSKKKFTILFVEGVHENFEMLYSHEECEIFGAKARKIADNIYCLNRGEIYTIDGKKVFALGGGAHEDVYEKYDNDPLKNPSLPTDEELEYSVKNLQSHNKKVDLVITHEAPASVKRMIRRDSVINDMNIFLDTLLHNIQCEKWYFGSMHTDRVIFSHMECLYQNVVKFN